MLYIGNALLESRVVKRFYQESQFRPQRPVADEATGEVRQLCWVFIIGSCMPASTAPGLETRRSRLDDI